MRLLAKALGVPRAAVSIVGGQTSPRKTVEVEGLELSEVRERLGAGDGGA